MELTVQKRLAAQILKCSEKKVRIDPTRLDEIKEAITKRDIRGLIKAKAIIKNRDAESSRVRARMIREQKKKGKRKGPGTRRGPINSRLSRKDRWIARIRAQRKLVKELKTNGKITKETYNDIYSKSKGGFFRSRRHINLYLEEHDLIQNENKKL
jgi:large subunit ribosomal protein L19e